MRGSFRVMPHFRMKGLNLPFSVWLTWPNKVGAPPGTLPRRKEFGHTYADQCHQVPAMVTVTLSSVDPGSWPLPHLSSASYSPVTSYSGSLVVFGLSYLDSVSLALQEAPLADTPGLPSLSGPQFPLL